MISPYQLGRQSYQTTLYNLLLISLKWLFPISLGDETLIFILGKAVQSDNIKAKERKTIGITTSIRKICTQRMQGYKKCRREKMAHRTSMHSPILSFGKKQTSKIFTKDLIYLLMIL